jgi:hypothetical protein
MRAPTQLHELLDAVPEAEWPAAQRYLEFLGSRASNEVEPAEQELPADQVALLNQALDEVGRGELVDGEAFFAALRQQLDGAAAR